MEMGKIYIPMWMRVFSVIGNKNTSKIARCVETEYAHAHKILKELKSMKLIIIIKKGRSNNIEFTKKGEKIRDSLNVLMGLRQWK